MNDHLKIAAAALVGVVPNAVQAQDANQTPVARDEGASVISESSARPPTTIEVSARGLYQLATDLDDGGEVSVARAFVSAKVETPILPRLSLTSEFRAGDNWYDFAENSLTPGVDPFDELQFYDLEFTASYRQSRRWILLGGLGAHFGGESGVDLDDGWSAKGLVGAIYNVNPKLSIGGILFARTEVEDDALVLPLPIIRYQIDDRWSIGTSRDAGWFVNHHASDTWNYSLSFGYLDERYRLADDGPAPGGVFNEYRFPVRLTADWTPRKGVTISPFVGFEPYQNYRLENSNGDEIEETSLRPAVSVGIGGSIQF